jgi:DNA-binding transcriptional regulator LsrR (DeoR family)
MPVPGSLKRQPINPNEIARLLEAQFDIPTLETLAYVQMVGQRKVGVDELAATLSLSKTEAQDLVQSMRLRGLIIQAAESEEAFSALHPRMTLTNIFKLYEKDVVQSLRDRRATVDRLVNLLTPIYEEKPAK